MGDDLNGLREMSIGSNKLLLLGAGTLLAAGIVVWQLAKQHEQRLTTTSAIAAAVLQAEVANATGLGIARGIRIPFYEGESRQPTSIMLGKTATPLEGGRYLVNDLRVENYSYSPGATVTNFVIEAPRCLLDPTRKMASSEGRMVISRPDGSFLMTGMGFEWRQAESFLTISNEVSTHLTSAGLNPFPPTKP